MRLEDFVDDKPGELVLVARPQTPEDLLNLLGGEAQRPSHILAFSPNPLPPTVTYDGALVNALGRSMRALGRLDERAIDLPNPTILIRPLQAREAVESSRIEGTVADLEDLALYQANVPSAGSNRDVKEVANYEGALRYGLQLVPDRGVTVGMIRDLHQRLFEGIEPLHFQPGRIRTRPLFIGQTGDRAETARFVPSPPTDIEGQLLDLERYIQGPSETSDLIRIAMVHYQFETIHPFPDGNGRVGRLLIPLLLRQCSIMRFPCIDLSAYVAKHRDRYVDALLRVSQKGAWGEWITFFLEVMENQAIDTLNRISRLLNLRDRYIHIMSNELRIKAADAVVDHLLEYTSLTASQLSSLSDVSFTTAQRSIEDLEHRGMLKESTGRKRGRVYLAREIIGVLDARDEDLREDRS